MTNRPIVAMMYDFDRTLCTKDMQEYGFIPVSYTHLQDFATGLEWVLNFYKNDSNNTAMPIEMIKGAKEYYEYTKTLSEDEAKALTAGEGSKFREMVGLETPDDHTVVYHCVTEKPYFDSLASYVALYPLSQGMVCLLYTSRCV